MIKTLKKKYKVIKSEFLEREFLMFVYAEKDDEEKDTL